MTIPDTKVITLSCHTSHIVLGHELWLVIGVSGAEGYSPEQQHWMLRIKELRQTAKTFARGLTFRRSTPHGIADANTHHHDFEYFYERN